MVLHCRPMPGLAPGEGGLAGLQSLMQEGVPSLRQLLQPVVDDMDPENGIEEEYKVLCISLRHCCSLS